jgi:transcriptional regulator with XRE-family HTH domain
MWSRTAWPSSAGGVRDLRARTDRPGNFRDIGPTIGHIRRVLDLSQEELAFRAEIHRTLITNYEHGKRTPMTETLAKIAGALGVPLDDLLPPIRWEPPGIGHSGRWVPVEESN